MTKILVTGVAGFIGMHTSLKLLSKGLDIIGIDNMNSYYDPTLKQARLDQLKRFSNFKFFEVDIADTEVLKDIFAQTKPNIVINLAAQAGVRYSLENPNEYIRSNVLGFTNILEGARDQRVEHLIYASSSSVYGSNTTYPFSEDDNVDHPVSLYAATKKSNELMAHTYSHLFDIPTTGLRFFTVYGPWGRPDMALFLFTKAILERRPIDVFNNGQMIRDFTYVDDVVESIVRLTERVPEGIETPEDSTLRPSVSNAPYRIFNIGNGSPTPLMDYIRAIEQAVDIKAEINYLGMQPGDVPITNADNNAIYQWINYRPNTKVEDGIRKFVDWYVSYYS
jgi:UDP-glucuronate 4-epimerase